MRFDFLVTVGTAVREVAHSVGSCWLRGTCLRHFASRSAVSACTVTTIFMGKYNNLVARIRILERRAQLEMLDEPGMSEMLVAKEIAPRARAMLRSLELHAQHNSACEAPCLFARQAALHARLPPAQLRDALRCHCAGY